MSTTADVSTRRRVRRRNRIRAYFRSQTQLWDRVLDDLEPWRHEGPLRWHGGRLDGLELDGNAGAAPQGSDARS